jgi:hypothetical protein
MFKCLVNENSTHASGPRVARSFTYIRSTKRYSFLVMLLLASLISTLDGHCQSVNGTDNGIAVGRPKLFDNRSLQIMLDSLNQQLQSAQFFNQATIGAALGVLQGSESFDVTRNLNVSASFLPKTTPPPAPTLSGSLALPGTPSGQQPGSFSLTLPKSSGGAGSGGSTANTTAATGSSSGGSAQSTTPATLPILVGSPGQFGSSANDLLADQVNLTYQVFNLRLLLERSITDRLLMEQNENIGRTRLQAVIGFNVSLDPPKETKDSAAIVEITISLEHPPANPTSNISLVAVMPQEKTYNSSALNTHDNAFGGSAVAKMITVGYSERHRGQVFYLFRDNDTMAFERMAKTPDPNTLRFGWQFRPVLGRRSVSPGTRQMFAIIALPDNDEPPTQNQPHSPVQIHVKVDTYWKHFEHRSLTTAYNEAWVHYINPVGIANIPLRLPDPWPVEYSNIEVPRSAGIEDSLTPIVDRVDWIPTSNTQGTVVVHGKNFFSGTTVSLAGQQYTGPGDGFVLQSDQTMVLSSTVQAVATGDGVINGRYGKSVLLAPDNVANNYQRLYVGPFELRPFGSEYSKLTLNVGREGAPLLLADALPPKAVFIRYNDAVLDVPTEIRQDDANPDTLDISTYISNAVLGSGDGVVTVKFPFGGKSWEAKKQIYQPLLPIVTRTGGKDKATLAIAFPRPYGMEFRGNWKIILDKIYQIGDPGDRDTDADVSVRRATDCSVVEPSCHLVILSAKTALLDTFQKFVIVSDAGDSLGVSIPSVNPVNQAAQINAANTSAMLQNEARVVTFYGQGLGLIKRVFFSNQDLPFTVKADGTAITVFISPDVTSKAGHKDIVFQMDQNTLLAGGIDVLATGGAGSPGQGNANSVTPNATPNNQ